MKNNKGVTLVALVVTIIVLIILAGISINLILGDNGIITIAKKAKENTELARIEEETELNELYTQFEEDGGSSGGTIYDVIAKLTEFKTAIANYIEEAGGIKPEISAETSVFGDSIKGIVKEVTKDATSVADNISEGKTAWVDGVKVTGTGADNKAYYEQGKKDGKETILQKLHVDTFESFDVAAISGATSSFSINTGTNSGAVKSGSFNYKSEVIYTNSTPDGKAALLNTITFKLSNSNNNSSNGGSSSSSASYTIYDGSSDDNIVIASGNKGTISINLFSYTLTNNYITIVAKGNGYAKHGTVSKDGVATASGSISEVKANYLTLAYE